jgi:tetratricopeptide (TPR) repeat protein
VKYVDINQRAQQQDTLNYAVAYHSTGVFFGQNSRYDEAIEFMRRSYDIRPKGDSILKEIDLLSETKALDFQFADLVRDRDRDKLTLLGNNLFTLASYKRCSEVFLEIVRFASDDAFSFNNLASCQVNLGKLDEARGNYKKALEIDPKLEIAKQGLENLSR